MCLIKNRQCLWKNPKSKSIFKTYGSNFKIGRKIQNFNLGPTPNQKASTGGNLDYRRGYFSFSLCSHGKVFQFPGASKAVCSLTRTNEKYSEFWAFFICASAGNRTRAQSLARTSSTIKPHSLVRILYTKKQKRKYYMLVWSGIIFSSILKNFHDPDSIVLRARKTYLRLAQVWKNLKQFRFFRLCAWQESNPQQQFRRLLWYPFHHRRIFISPQTVLTHFTQAHWINKNIWMIPLN